MGAGSTAAGEPVLPLKVYGYRWVILGAFCLVTLLNGAQWVQFSIIADSVVRFYSVSQQAVDWTSMIYMLMYVPFVLPASWMLDKKGLRWTVTVAAVLNCLAAWIKLAGCRQDLFAVMFSGQAVAAIAQAFILAVPARLAAVWFGASQVSTACAIGVFGNQVGTGVGFLVPPMIVHPDSRLDLLGDQLRYVAYGVAALCTLSLIVVILVFQDAPPLPPTHAQALVRSGNREAVGLLQSARRMFATPGFVSLLIAYGISTGVYYAISTVLNYLDRAVFQTSSDAGNIGMVVVVSGLLGSILCGVVLDATGKHKQVTLAVYFLSMVGMAAFTVSFATASLWAVYGASFVLGFFLTGYLPVGFEFAAELTYPEPEGTSAGLLNVSAQLFGVLFTELCGWALQRDPGSHLWVNIALSGALLVGGVLTAMVPARLRRQEAQLTGDSAYSPPAHRTSIKRQAAYTISGKASNDLF